MIVSYQIDVDVDLIDGEFQVETTVPTEMSLLNPTIHSLVLSSIIEAMIPEDDLDRDDEEEEYPLPDYPEFLCTINNDRGRQS